eukprot:jgi/Chlat1/8068/Chrsp73S07528
MAAAVNNNNGNSNSHEKDMTPEAVLQLNGPCKGFLCPLSANVYGIEFLQFEIRDYDSGRVLFSVKREGEAPPMPSGPIDPAVETAMRTIRYTFPAEFFKFKTIRTALVFGVGPREVPNFRMIERHYFRGKLLRSYDFKFGFCIPNSTNSWEAVYPVPKLSKDEIKQMLAAPYETSSDTFYFVNNQLVMHNKAEYAYRQTS